VAFGATAQRMVVAETLDGLDERDPAAQRSRRDLRRIHVAMGTRAIVGRALGEMVGDAASPMPTGRPLRILELGAGDGSLMLGVARALHRRWPRVELTLLDRQSLIEPATVAGYAALGWTVMPQVVDVLAWADAAPDDVFDQATARWDLIVTTLFLHHFDGAAFTRLLGAIERRTDRFFACEPRRAPLALVGSHLVGALGANAVTREDAVLSVRAGFRGDELARLWPGRAGDWRLHEYQAGLFSHCLRAERHSAEADARLAASPSSMQPEMTRPSSTPLSSTQPSATHPSTTHPSIMHPSIMQPSSMQPSSMQPWSVRPSNTAR